jgi:hypothetical protein
MMQKKLTLGTAAWKEIPLMADPPEAWKRARIITIPGLAADVCGVKVTFNPFLSYAEYAVRRGALGVAGVTGIACVNVAGTAVAGVAGYDMGTEGVWGTAAGVAFEPKSPKISSTDDFCGCGAGGDGEVVADDEPKISASRSWLDCAF